MIRNINQESFVVELKQRMFFAEWHKRSYAECSRIWNRRDYCLRCVIGILSLVGIVMAGSDEWREIGAFLAGGCALVMANLLPILKWDSIVSGFREEEEAWTRIFKGYEDVVNLKEIAENKDEILIQEFQKIKETQTAAALNMRWLPHHKKIWVKCDKEVREYHNLPEDPYKTIENKGENK